METVGDLWCSALATGHLPRSQPSNGKQSCRVDFLAGGIHLTDQERICSVLRPRRQTPHANRRKIQCNYCLNSVSDLLKTRLARLERQLSTKRQLQIARRDTSQV